MAQDKLVAYHIERLKINTRMDVRLDSINELRLLGDAAAMPILEEVYRTDPEPEVRKAAQLAGKAIFEKNMKRP
jgi:hypothetical protein